MQEPSSVEETANFSSGPMSMEVDLSWSNTFLAAPDLVEKTGQTLPEVSSSLEYQ